MRLYSMKKPPRKTNKEPWKDLKGKNKQCVICGDIIIPTFEGDNCCDLCWLNL